ATDAGIDVTTTLPGIEIRPLVMALIGDANSSLDLELYVLTDSRVVDALIAAHDRGVTGRLLLDPSERPSDGPAARLRQAGVAVRLYHGDGEKLHAKVAVADASDVIFGSANWTHGGFERNHELDVAVRHAP